MTAMLHVLKYRLLVFIGIELCKCSSIVHPTAHTTPVVEQDKENKNCTAASDVVFELCGSPQFLLLINNKVTGSLVEPSGFLIYLDLFFMLSLA